MSKISIKRNVVVGNVISNKILLMFDYFDEAHQRDHIFDVIKNTFNIIEASELHVDKDIALVAALYHDTGLICGRDKHHEYSGMIVRNDVLLKQIFNEEEINIIAEACEDHRASNPNHPRSIYGRILSDADRTFSLERFITRAIKYRKGSDTLDNQQESYKETLEIIKQTYATGGYVKDFYFRERCPIEQARFDKFVSDQQFALKIFNKLWYSVKG